MVFIHLQKIFSKFHELSVKILLGGSWLVLSWYFTKFTSVFLENDFLDVVLRYSDSTFEST